MMNTVIKTSLVWFCISLALILGTKSHERNHFREALKHGGMSTEFIDADKAVDYRLVDFDEKTMDMTEDGTITRKDRSKFNVEVPCYFVQGYGCFVGKGA
jgi:hypothetical protein